MLPGDAPPGRGAPGLGAPGRGAMGRGMGRSTGCADEKGLLPTRGVRTPGLGIGLGRGPGVMPGCGARSPGAGCPGLGPGRPGGAVGVGGAGGAGVAVVAAGAGAAGAGLPPSAALAGALAGAPLPATVSIALSRARSSDASGALAAGAAGTFAGALAPSFAGAGLLPPKDSRSRRATGASTVDDADLTNSPCSLSRASTSLLVTPSSFANSCTRALPATTSPVCEATVVGRASGLAMTHGHRDFTVCSCSLLPVLLPGERACLRNRRARPPRMCPVNR